MKFHLEKFACERTHARRRLATSKKKCVNLELWAPRVVGAGGGGFALVIGEVDIKENY